MKKLRILFLALVPALVLMVSACASDGDNGGSTERPVDPRCASTDNMTGYDNVSGTWEIYNRYGLINLNTEVVAGNNSIDVKLVCDIDLKGSESNPWVPIGDYYNSIYYTGTFDGDNYTINNLYLNNTEDEQGLFSAFQGVIKNLYVKNVNITAGYYVGTIVGSNGGKIINTHVSDVTINGTDDVGAITGYNYGLIYASSANDVTLSVTEDGADIGGIVGYNASSDTIMASFVNNVTLIVNDNNSEVGGIAGNNNGYIISSFTNNVSVTDNYTGTVIGRIVGNNNNGIVSENYFITSDTSLSGIGTTSDNTNASPISNIAELNSKIDGMNKVLEGYLILINITDGYRYKVINNNTFPIFEAYEALSAFIISDADDLTEFRDLVNAGLNNMDAKLTADIDLTGVTWVPIGTDTRNYLATFDGDNYTISNLTINNANSNQALFGYTGGNSLIKNLKMDNVTITTTSNFAGAVVGTIRNFNSNTPSMINVHASNVTINGNDILGGLVAYNAVGLITSSSATNVNITATGQASNDGSGGVVGVNDSNVVATYANGITITANAGDSPNIGGIVGRNSNNVGTLTASYANDLAFTHLDNNTKVGGVTGWIKEPATLNSNYFVSSDNALFGVGLIVDAESIAQVDNATRVDTIQELNNNVNTINNAIDAFVADNASREFGYRYEDGIAPTTDIPTFITYP